MRISLDSPRYDLHKLSEKLTIAVAWRLPHKLVMWSAIRLVAHGTSGAAYENQIVPDLTAMEALKRWDDPRGGDRVHGGRP